MGKGLYGFRSKEGIEYMSYIDKMLENSKVDVYNKDISDFFVIRGI